VNFLVLSRQHQLLPFAHRLTREGHSARSIIYHSGNKAKYERAYEGVIELLSQRGEKERGQKIKALQQIAADGQTVVLANDTRAVRDFEGAALLYPTIRTKEPAEGALRLGAWFDGESLLAPHLLLVDEGAQAGGLGSREPGSMTMVRLDAFDWFLDLVESQVDDLKSRNFRGLVQWGLQDADSRIVLAPGRSLGWPKLHTHAFVSELENFGEILSQERSPEVQTRFTVAVHVSQAPWPHRTQDPWAEVEIQGLSDDLMGRVFWHDVRVDQNARTVQTAGLDGWVGVARGAGDSFELAQSRALGVAGAMVFPEKQFRMDAGARVRHVLGLLEQEYGLEFG